MAITFLYYLEEKKCSLIIIVDYKVIDYSPTLLLNLKPNKIVVLVGQKAAVDISLGFDISFPLFCCHIDRA